MRHEYVRHYYAFSSSASNCRLCMVNTVSRLRRKLRLAKDIEDFFTTSLWGHSVLTNGAGCSCCCCSLADILRIESEYVTLIQDFDNNDHDLVSFSFRASWHAEPLFPDECRKDLQHWPLHCSHSFLFCADYCCNASCSWYLPSFCDVSSFSFEEYLRRSLESIRDYVEALENFKRSFVLVNWQRNSGGDGDYPSWDGNHQIRTHVHCRSLGSACIAKLTKRSLPRKRSFSTLGKPASNIDRGATTFTTPIVLRIIRYIN